MKNIIAILSIVFSLIGCAGGEPTRYYLIDSVIPEPVTMAQSPKVELLDVEIPQYLERYQIASRRADNQIVFAASNQWGENLRKNLIRTMARNLTNALGTTSVGSPNLRLADAVDVYIKVYIERFERGPDGYVYLTARWQLLNGNNQTLRNASSDLVSARPVNSTDYAGTVNQLSVLVGELTNEIATTIKDPTE